MHLWRFNQRKHFKTYCMKKLFIIAGLIFAGISTNAQLYMGARFDIIAEQINNDAGDKKTSKASIGMYADLGYHITAKMDIGAEYGGTLGFTKNHTSDTKDNTANWLFSPYLRYSVFQKGNFELLGKGSFILEGSKTYYLVGIQVVPVIAYHLNDHIALQTNLNFFNFGVSFNKIKDGDARTYFNLGGNSSNVVNLGNLTIGFIYKF